MALLVHKWGMATRRFVYWTRSRFTDFVVESMFGFWTRLVEMNIKSLIPPDSIQVSSGGIWRLQSRKWRPVKSGAGIEPLYLFRRICSSSTLCARG